MTYNPFMEYIGLVDYDEKLEDCLHPKAALTMRQKRILGFLDFM